MAVMAMVALLMASPCKAVDLRATFSSSLDSGDDPILQRVMAQTQGHSPSLRQLAAGNARLHELELHGGSSLSSRAATEETGFSSGNLAAFLDRNVQIRDNLEQLFRRIDRDSDDRISEMELASLSGISRPQLDAIMSLDLDQTGFIHRDQFLQIPILVTLLENQPALLHLLRSQDADGRVRRSAIRQVLVEVMRGSEDSLMETSGSAASASLAEVESQGLPTSLSSVLSSGLAAAAQAVTQGTGFQQPVPLQPPLPQGPNGVPNSPWEAVNLTMTGSKPLSGRLRDDLFKQARFGIPSEANEHCVMCQFAVQMIRRMLYEHVRGVAPHLLTAAPVRLPPSPGDSPGNGDDDEGDTGDGYTDPIMEASAAGSPSDWPNLPRSVDEMRAPPIETIDKAVSAAMKQRGARGLVRLLTEDVFNELCSVNNIPELFYPSCRVLWAVSRRIDHSIFFRFPSSLTCAEAGLCGADTYFQSNFAVHMPDQSRTVNGRRGLCGLSGGNHDLHQTMCQSGANLMFLESHAG